ncbi:MAG: hypothetical protein VCF07_19415, partial [Nitrospinota bacterium]
MLIKVMEGVKDMEFRRWTVKLLNERFPIATMEEFSRKDVLTWKVELSDPNRKPKPFKQNTVFNLLKYGTNIFSVAMQQDPPVCEK